MWKQLLRVVKGIWFTLLWCVAVVFGGALVDHGLGGYSRCPGVGPGESCSYTSVRGTVRVAYEDLEEVDVVSLVIGSLFLLFAALAALLVVLSAVDFVKARRRNRG